MKTPVSRLRSTTVLTLALLVPFSAADAAKSKMDTPILSCSDAAQVSLDLLVCAGTVTGAPAGVSLQWLTADALAAGADGILGTADDNAWSSTTPGYCHASLSGNANGGTYSLGPGQCLTVNIGDNLFDDPGASSNCPSTPLQCGTTYAFRGFAHATSSHFRSNFTATLFCATDACEPVGGCTFTQGYWKTHGPIPTGNNVNEWPVTALTLGTVTYTDLELQAIFDTPAAGNGLVALAHQLIAAKLNVANGSDDTAIAAAIAAADGLIGGLVVPPVGSGSLPNSSTSALTGTLTSFNEGTIGPGHCGG